MDRVVNIQDAQTHLSRIVDEVAAGTEVILAKAGKPVARLTPLAPVTKAKKLGLMKGKIRVRDDFNAPVDDEALAGFEAR